MKHSPHRSWDDDGRTVEARMLADLDDEDAWVGAACTSLLDAGGKRLRASMVLHCAKAAGANLASRAAEGAAAVEVLHLGTLVHDDIADRAKSRRGVIAVHEQWGNWTASLVGARMFLQSATTLFELAPAMRGRFIEVVVELCTGQMRDVSGDRTSFASEDESVRAYLQVAQKKTASLFSFACELGALLGKASEPRQRLAARWGRRFGVLYQIVDDLVDLFGDERLLGKPAGSDLCEGRRSFPWVITNLDPEEYRLWTLTDRSAALAAARLRVIEAGGLAAAETCARALAREAEVVRISFEGAAQSVLSEAMDGLLRKLTTICGTAEPATQALRRCAQTTADWQAILSELDQRPTIAPDFGSEQFESFLATHAPGLSMPGLWQGYETSSVVLAARAAADTTRAFGGACNDVSEAGFWCALSVEVLSGLRGREYAVDCKLLIAGDAALVRAMGHVLALDSGSATALLRGTLQTIRGTLRTASPGVPFGGPPIQPASAKLHPLVAAVARVAAHLAGASWSEARAVAEHWVLLMHLATDASCSALPTPALLSDMHQRIGSMSLPEPAILLASLPSSTSYASP